MSFEYRRVLSVFLGVVCLLAFPSAGCFGVEEPAEALTRLSASQERIELVAVEGEGSVSQALAIYSSAEDEPLEWEANDDALWLKVAPSWGTFDCGVAEVVVWADTSGMDIGEHSAGISILVSEADNTPLTIPVELRIEPGEDPAVVAAREFWEGGRYETYWSLYASVDAVEAVTAYSYATPEVDYGKTMGRWHQSVDVKEYEFKYLPEEYQRPIALVVCRITFSRQYLDKYGDQFAEEWVGNWDVILQVEPGPYDLNTNKWRVIDYSPHEPESSMPKWTLQ